MDWSQFWIEHAGRRRAASFFGESFLPELLRVVNTHAPLALSFLEWGTGMSTLLLANIARQRNGSVVTIDHIPEYANSVMLRLKDFPVRSLIGDLTGPKLSQADTGLNYSNLPLSLGENFDFIFIDGRRRMECAFVSLILAQPSTIVVLHDYRRSRYQIISILFETLELNEQFRVMKPKRALLDLIASDREKVIKEILSSS
jgi:predicted O-methyltransferase YrrM